MMRRGLAQAGAFSTTHGPRWASLAGPPVAVRPRGLQPPRNGWPGPRAGLCSGGRPAVRRLRRTIECVPIARRSALRSKSRGHRLASRLGDTAVDIINKAGKAVGDAGKAVGDAVGDAVQGARDRIGGGRKSAARKSASSSAARGKGSSTASKTKPAASATRSRATSGSGAKARSASSAAKSKPSGSAPKSKPAASRSKAAPKKPSR